MVDIYIAHTVTTYYVLWNTIDISCWLRLTVTSSADLIRFQFILKLYRCLTHIQTSKYEIKEDSYINIIMIADKIVGCRRMYIYTIIIHIYDE